MKKLVCILFICFVSTASAQWNKTVVDDGIISNDTIYLQSLSFQNYLGNGDTILAHVYGYTASDSEEFAYCIFDSIANIFRIDSIVLNYYNTHDAVNFPSDTGVAYVTVQYWYNYADLLFDNDNDTGSFIVNLSIGDTVKNSHNYEPLDIDGSHHLHQISLTGTTGKILFSNGTGSGTSFQDGGSVFLLHVPTVSYPNLVNPATTGIVPLILKAATLSDTTIFEARNSQNNPVIVIDSGGAIGLFDGSVIQWGTTNSFLSSQGQGKPPRWTNIDSSGVIGDTLDLLAGTGHPGVHSIAQPSQNGMVLCLSNGHYPFWSETPPLGDAGHNTGILYLHGSNTGILGITIPDSVISYNIKLPLQQGAANTFLKNDGSGNLSWASATVRDTIIAQSQFQWNINSTAGAFHRYIPLNINYNQNVGDVSSTCDTVNGSTVTSIAGTLKRLSISWQRNSIAGVSAGRDSFIVYKNCSPTSLIVWYDSATFRNTRIAVDSIDTVPFVAGDHFSLYFTGVGNATNYESAVIVQPAGLVGNYIPAYPHDGTLFLAGDSTWKTAVTSVSGSGGTTGLALTGGAITTSGTLTLGGTLVEANGGTNQTSYTTGDILYASASNTLAKRAIGTTGDVLTVSGGVPTWSAGSSLGAGTGFFGDGSDAGLTYDGTTTILGMAPAANVYTLTRDIYASSIIVKTGVTIKTNGFRIYCSGILSDTGTISNNGNNAVGTTAAANTSTTSALGYGRASNAGNAGTGAAIAGLSATTVGGGGNGGAANATSGGVVVVPTVAMGGSSAFRNFNVATTGFIFTFVVNATGNLTAINGGASGATGAVAAPGGNGGTGGGGGGVIIINAGTVIVNTGGKISCNGGAASVGTGTNTGGSGGGGGGLIFITTHSYANNGTVSANGGTKSAPTGTGATANDGSSGNVIVLTL